MSCMNYSSSNSLFKHNNNISVSVNNSNSTLAYFKQAYHDNLGADKKQAW